MNMRLMRWTVALLTSVIGVSLNATNPTPAKDQKSKIDAKSTSEIPVPAESSVKVSTKTKKKRDYNRPSGVGSDVYFGAIFGLSSTSAEIGSGEPERSGSYFGLRATGSIHSGSFGIAGGVGWFANELKADELELKKFADLPEDDVRRKKSIKSSGAFLEFNPYFSPHPDVQFGPLAHIELAPYRLQLPGEDAKGQIILAGARAAYELEKNDILYRFGVEYLVDINIEARSIHNIIGGLDIGFLIKDRFTRVVEKRRTERRREVVEKIVEKPVEKKVVLKQVTMVFDQQMVNFVTAKSELLPASQTKLEKLAKFLASNRLLWAKVIIEGHTDRRGELEYNMRLSMDRAVSVGQALTRNGVDPSQITWAGLGPTRPLDPGDSDIAFARNRRVEIKFDGVTDEEALRNGVMQAMSSN